VEWAPLQIDLQRVPVPFAFDRRRYYPNVLRNDRRTDEVVPRGPEMVRVAGEQLQHRDDENVVWP